MRRYITNIVLAAVSTLIAVGGCEAGLRILYPRGALGSGVELAFLRERSAAWMSALMVPDEEIGFRPKPGVAGGYDRDGLLRRSLANGSAVRRRILFLGDSVTARGRIVDAIREQLGDPETEYLNGGVEAFNLAQEVGFFLKFQSTVEVNHIIHQVHGNDLRATPIVFRDQTGTLNAYLTNSPRQHVNQWLFQHSYLYRIGLAAFLSQAAESDGFAEARDSFARMADFAARHGIRYDVVLFPILAPEAALSPTDRRDWQALERACRETVSQCVSLLPVLDRMLARGRSVEEVPGDTWHPNDAFAAAAASSIISALGLKDDRPDPSSSKTTGQ